MSLQQDERDARVAWAIHLRDERKAFWPPGTVFPRDLQPQPPRDPAQPTTTERTDQ
jgi:hypothetical protein